MTNTAFVSLWSHKGEALPAEKQEPNQQMPCVPFKDDDLSIQPYSLGQPVQTEGKMQFYLFNLSRAYCAPVTSLHFFPLSPQITL